MSTSTSDLSNALSSFITTFRTKSILSVTQFTHEHLLILLKIAAKMYEFIEIQKQNRIPLCTGVVLATLFYEPSTRTSSSFQTAMLRLGGQVLAINDVSNSSVAKGETIEDTIKCLQSYVDVIAMRHPQVGSLARAASVATVPIVNAGDGVGEHPTQALLDLFTIAQERSNILKSSDVDADKLINELTITMVGDLKHGRTVHSLSLLLAQFNVTLNYVAPESLRMPQHIIDEVNAIHHKNHPSSTEQFQFEHQSLDNVLSKTDILYMTRVQKERFASIEDYNAVADSFIITPDLLTRLNSKSTLRILHPLPRVNEISTDVDSDVRAAYFRQMRCGLFMRMALLSVLVADPTNPNMLLDFMCKS
jgi:aspartate carbamoyltransferase